MICAFGVFLFCSLAGADLANRGNRRLQACFQLLWPVLFLGAPLAFPEGVLVSVVAFALQAILALMMAFGLEEDEVCRFDSSYSGPAIGWEAL